MTCSPRVKAARRALLAGLFFYSAGTLPVLAGDASAGADVFKQECAECHTTKEGKNKKGPSLFGIVGRNAGSLDGYSYSDALKNAKWTWTEDKLHWYLSQPAKQANPGTKMKYSGLDDAKQLDDLIAYLQSNH
ncbi:c-type cytochrome [Dyella sp. C11]|uniref:c-type cytochrome n=1 Tax=Dyella sp. C11 TaxID=2126991 RepID=UPI00271455AA|nr:c-type cytochrome [Dyella sp. C11]